MSEILVTAAFGSGCAGVALAAVKYGILGESFSFGASESFMTLSAVLGLINLVSRRNS